MRYYTGVRLIIAQIVLLIHSPWICATISSSKYPANAYYSSNDTTLTILTRKVVPFQSRPVHAPKGNEPTLARLSRSPAKTTYSRSKKQVSRGKSQAVREDSTQRYKGELTVKS